jgi:hypothetical protein
LRTVVGSPPIWDRVNDKSKVILRGRMKRGILPP